MTDADISQKSARSLETVKRVINAKIRGSMHDFAKNGVEAASWSPVNGKVGDVFGVYDVLDSNADIGTSAATLQTAVISSVKLLECKNEFPVDLGVNVSCIPAEETIKTGHKYTFTSMAQTYNPTVQTLFTADEKTGDGCVWRQQYPEYNATNLETHGVLTVNGQNYTFVSKDHPVIDLLRQNSEMLNTDIDSFPLIDGQYFKITKQVFATCCSALRTKVLKNVGTQDLNNFTVQISRLGNKDWINMQDNNEILSAIPHEVYVENNEQKTADYCAALMRRNFALTARFEITYNVNPHGAT
jgi:hypothetical protein